MSLFRFTNLEIAPTSGVFSEAYCVHPAVQRLAEERGIKLIPFDSKRDFANIHLLYPTWTAREMALNIGVRSALSQLAPYKKHPGNFVTCMKDGEISFVLGFSPVKDRNIFELSFVSGKPLKRIWSHKLAEVFSLYLSYMMQRYPKHILIASCDSEFPVYSNFVKHFDFIFWEEYTIARRKYILHLFNPIQALISEKYQKA